MHLQRLPVQHTLCNYHYVAGYFYDLKIVAVHLRSVQAGAPKFAAVQTATEKQIAGIKMND